MFDNKNYNEQQGGEDFLKKLLDDLKSKDSVIRVQMNDQRLMRLAEYDTTHGYLKLKITPEDIQSRFSELKTRIKTGSFSLKQLEDDVYNRWGITEESREESLRDEQMSGIKKPTPIGFCIDNMDVADIPEDSPKNS